MQYAKYLEFNNLNFISLVKEKPLNSHILHLDRNKRKANTFGSK